MPPTEKLSKGQAAYNLAGWPCIVIQASRRKHNADSEPILCEVWGPFHECGSVYRGELSVATDEAAWKQAVRQYNGDPGDRYFKGVILFDAPPAGEQKEGLE